MSSRLGVSSTNRSSHSGLVTAESGWNLSGTSNDYPSLLDEPMPFPIPNVSTHPGTSFELSDIKLWSDSRLQAELEANNTSIACDNSDIKHRTDERLQAELEELANYSLRAEAEEADDSC
jgi:hypothetical protein